MSNLKKKDYESCTSRSIFFRIIFCRWNFCSLEVGRRWASAYDWVLVKQKLVSSFHLFQTVAPYDPRVNPQVRINVPQPPMANNDYTQELCDKLEIKNPIVEYFKLVESGSISVNARSSCGDDFNSSDLSFVTSFSSTPGNRRNRGSFFGSDKASNITGNDPNELDLGCSSGDDSGNEQAKSGFDGVEEFFMESFSKSSLPLADESEVFKSLNSTLEQSRTDPSAIDISAIGDDPKDKTSDKKVDISVTSESGGFIHSTPIVAKTFKRRNTIARNDTSTWDLLFNVLDYFWCVVIYCSVWLLNLFLISFSQKLE